MIDGKHIIVAAGLMLVAGWADAQISLSGQSAVYLYKTARTESERASLDGRPSFGWLTYGFIDASVSDHVTGSGTFRIGDNEALNVDYLAIRLTDLTPLGLTIQAGKIDLPFGNLGERRYPRRNPLFGLPVIYEYYTVLPDHIVPAYALLAYRGRGYGMRMLDSGMYDIGAMVSGSAGPFDYAYAVSNGTVSTASYGNENTNGAFGQIVRLAVTPFTGLTVGGAYNWGPYIDETYGGVPAGVDADSYLQRSTEADLEFSRGHLIVDAEGVYTTWKAPWSPEDLLFRVVGYYGEARYTLMPRLYVAFRGSGLTFDKVTLQSSAQPWDYDVTEWEGGLGYFIDRDVLLKLVRRETRIHGGTFPKDNLTVAELVVAY